MTRKHCPEMNPAPPSANHSRESCQGRRSSANSRRPVGPAERTASPNRQSSESFLQDSRGEEGGRGGRRPGWEGGAGRKQPWPPVPQVQQGLLTAPAPPALGAPAPPAPAAPALGAASQPGAARPPPGPWCPPWACPESWEGEPPAQGWQNWRVSQHLRSPKQVRGESATRGGPNPAAVLRPVKSLLLGKTRSPPPPPTPLALPPVSAYLVRLRCPLP